MEIALGHYLTVAAILFTLGIFGIFLNRKNIIVILMAIELILLSVNIQLVAFSAFLGDLVGQVFAMFALTVAAAEMLLLRGVDMVLDTWPDEPRVDPILLAGVRYGTPHIAGYSQQSKINATDFLIDALAGSLGLMQSRPCPSQVGSEQVWALE